MPRRMSRQLQRAGRSARQPAAPQFHEVEGEDEAAQTREAFLGRVGREPTAVAAALNRGDGAMRAGVVNRLQQEQGNAYVQRVLAETRGVSPSGLLLQRDTPKTKAPAPEAKAEAAKAKPDEVSDEDKKEFELLKGKVQDADAAAYVKHRRQFFGSDDAYKTFAAESDAELDTAIERKSGKKTVKISLRKFIELKGDAQTVFYRWVRKGYHTKGVKDVPKLILQGMSSEVKDALDSVRQAYGKKFSAGGFNPRPMKDAKYRYRLGTISEHALGNAVDIESNKNPIISVKDWSFIETLTGKKVDRKRWGTEKEAEALWNDIHDLNAEFVKKVAEKVEQVKKEQAAKGTDAGKASSKPAKPPDPLAVVLAGHKDLVKWHAGFFTLDWELVKALHKQGFLWGATFSNAVDLHHFELTAKPKTDTQK